MAEFRSAINQLYGEGAQKHYPRFERLINQFEQRFDRQPTEFFSSPGRTEIGGNHTDHNHGRVLAASVNLDSIAAASPNDSGFVTIYSQGYDKPFVVDLSDRKPVPEEKGTTNALIRGIAARFAELGYKIGGFDACFASDVLPGSGLSSSASIEVLIGTILNSFSNNNKIKPEEIAIIGQYSENKYFGKPCGLMDQTACAVGGIVTIDFADPTKPIVEKVDFDFEAQNYSLVVVDTGGNHADLTDDYAAVPAEMKAVARQLGKTVCREISMDELLAHAGDLRKSVGDRAFLRAFHFIQENERVVVQVQALRDNDFERFLKLVNESGNSSFRWLQNIYTTKNVSEQGVTVALALTELYLNRIGAGACRVHGGGFAGTIQVFIPNDAVAGYVELMEPVFGPTSVHVLNIRSIGAVSLVSLAK